MKKIEAYLDCVSPYSYHAFTYLLSHRSLLQQHQVEISIIPVFLAGIMQASGNNPPWKVDAKARYSTFDGERAQKYFMRVSGNEYYGGRKEGWTTPSFFPIFSLLPQRVLTYISTAYPQEIYEQTFLSFFHHLWSANPQRDLSKVDNLVFALRNTFVLPSNRTVDTVDNKKRAFSDEEIEKILKRGNTDEVKEMLKKSTEYCCKDLGAYGCPWFWVTNTDRSSPSSSSQHSSSSSSAPPNLSSTESVFPFPPPPSDKTEGEGEGVNRWSKQLARQDGGEPFFGSDRWQFIFDFLDIPYEDIRILPPGGRNDLENERIKEVLSKL